MTFVIENSTTCCLYKLRRFEIKPVDEINLPSNTNIVGLRVGTYSLIDSIVIRFCQIAKFFHMEQVIRVPTLLQLDENQLFHRS